MSENHDGEFAPKKAPKPLTALQEMEKQHRELREKMLAEKRRIKHDRVNNKQRAHVLMILGSIIDHAGKDKVLQVVAKADWLAANDRLAVEYYYGIGDHPATGKKQEKNFPDGEPST